MNHKKGVLFFILLLVVPGIPLQTSAGNVTGCHCFNDRVFNPADKFSADDYILTTSFNSFLARSFGITKREIVMLKMKGGVEQHDLIIGLHTAKTAGIDLHQVLDRVKAKKSWQATLLDPEIKDRISSDTHLKSIQSGQGVVEGSQQIINGLLSRFYLEGPEAVEEMSKKGFSEKELNLLFILARSSGENYQDIAGYYRKGGKSWSEIAKSMGFEPADAGHLVMNYSSGSGSARDVFREK